MQQPSHILQIINDFVDNLRATQFKGEIDQRAATRLVLATDNSIYQVMPKLVLFPKFISDLQIIFKTAKAKKFQGLYFTVRGGGTSTNGQSLTNGILIDCSKYLNEIKELNLKEEWIIVEPGVVLDQLNNYLKPHGYFFPISISTSSRATLGGMVNTNACGKGSTFYGRTLDQVLDMTLVLTDGTLFKSEEINRETLATLKEKNGIIGNVFCQLDKTLTTRAKEIEALYPNLPRTITGYGLKQVWNQDKTKFNLNSIIVGSEGTLATCAEIKLKIRRIPAKKAVCVLQYKDFHCALSDASVLTKANPEAIETLDQLIIGLARTDILYKEVKEFIDNPKEIVAGLTLIEFVGDNEQEVDNQLLQLNDIISENPKAGRVNTVIVKDIKKIKNLWELRKKSVGLLANTKTKRIPVSGIEDTLVPPEHLAEYIEAYQKILDEAELTYGMFGHVDAGCLHVRPALDLSDSNDEALYYALSDKVAALVQKYHGIMWGEHGKGFRSTYVPETFGPALFNELCSIKKSFDTNNILNPGKIASPSGQASDLIAINAPKNRGHFNRQISSSLSAQYTKMINCNGNGACFNVNVSDIMCPSYKVTKDRVHSPKGRAVLIREWLRLQSVGDVYALEVFSHDVFNALHGCLGCTACKTECPVQINIPQFKAKFLREYYKENKRKLRDKITAYSERIVSYQSKYPRFFNFLNRNFLARWASKNLIKIDDIPKLSDPNFNKLAVKQKIKHYSANEIINKPITSCVAIISDWITYCYDAEILISAYEFLNQLGVDVFVLREFENGESFNMKGYINEFKKITVKTEKLFSHLQQKNISLLGIEPSTTIAFNNNYVGQSMQVTFIQDWLLKNKVGDLTFHKPNKKIILFLHCMEKSDNLEHARVWASLFEKFGLTILLAHTGCCGMAGMYGHECEHVGYSKDLYKMSWEKYVKEDAILLATGYSCRSQIKRMSQQEVFHPIYFLNKLLKKQVRIKKT